MATDAEEAIYAFLKATSEVTALAGEAVAFRMYPEAAPQDEKRDHLTYQEISRRRVYHLGGTTNMYVSRIQLDCWSLANKPAKALAKAVQKAKGGQPQGRELDGFEGMMDGLKVHSCFIEDRRSQPDPPAHGEESPWRRRSMDAVITYDEP